MASLQGWNCLTKNTLGHLSVMKAYFKVGIIGTAHRVSLGVLNTVMVPKVDSMNCRTEERSGTVRSVSHI